MRNIRVLVGFLIRAVVLGLAVAFLVVWWKPTLLGAHTASAPAPGNTVPITRDVAAIRPPVVVASFADSVARAAPAVVNIYTARVVRERSQLAPLNQLFGDDWPSYRQRVERSLGSGVIVDAMGTIVTNQHVIAGADSIRWCSPTGETQMRPSSVRIRTRTSPYWILKSAICPSCPWAAPILAGGGHRTGDRQPLWSEPDGNPGHRERHRARSAWARYI